MTHRPTEPADPAERGRDLDDATRTALGKLSEAFEVVEDARGHLYGFHRLCGTADLTLGESVEAFREAGHDAFADRLETELLGRNILEGRWSYQVVEEYDDGYYALFRDLEAAARDDLADGQRHVFEARMKEDRRTHGARHHESHPEASGG